MSHPKVNQTTLYLCVFVLNRLRNKRLPYSVVTSSRSQPCPWDRSESVLGSAQQCLRPTPQNPPTAPLSRDVRACRPPRHAPRCLWHRGSVRAPLPSRGRAAPRGAVYVVLMKPLFGPPIVFSTALAAPWLVCESTAAGTSAATPVGWRRRATARTPMRQEAWL